MRWRAIEAWLRSVATGVEPEGDASMRVTFPGAAAGGPPSRRSMKREARLALLSVSLRNEMRTGGPVEKSVRVLVRLDVIYPGLVDDEVGRATLVADGADLLHALTTAQAALDTGDGGATAVEMHPLTPEAAVQPARQNGAQFDPPAITITLRISYLEA